MRESSNGVYEFFLNNIQKIVVPEELIKLEMSLSRFELIALLMVERSQNITMSCLAQGVAVPMSTATGIVDRLVKKDLLERGRSEEDRRIVTISLTDRGKKVASDVSHLFGEFIDKIRAIITEEEYQTVLGIIKKVVIALQNTGDSPTDKKDIRGAQRKSITIE